MKDNIKIKLPSNKSFGIVFFVVFLLIALYPLVYDQNIRVWSFILSLFFLLLVLKNSKILTPLNIIWLKLGLILGKLVAPIVMGFVFFLVVTPIGITMKMFKKDLLNLKYSDFKSYWIHKNEPKSKMKNQF